MANPQSAIVIDNLSKRYHKDGPWAVHKLNLDVHLGEVFGFLGPNGAGKSTTIRMLMGAISPTSGQATISGHDVTASSRTAHRQVGYLAADMPMDNELTGRQYLHYLASIRGNVDWKHVEKLVHQLECNLQAKIGQLSRGNRQKIALVAALMHNPQLLILDEPTSGLDPLMQNQFNQLIGKRRAQGQTTFVSSHVLSEVQSICDRVGFIRAGKLVDVRPLDELMSQAFKKVRLTSRAINLERRLRTMKGLTNLEVQGHTYHFRLKDHLPQLLSLLQSIKPTDVAIEDANLDDLFMHYYGSSTKARRATDV